MAIHIEKTIRNEICSESSVRRVAAMLNMEPDLFKEGMPLPIGWQFLLLGADTKRSALRNDGFPGLGVPMPDLGLPRLLLGGRSVQYLSDIRIGERVQRTSSIEDLTQKESKAGPMAIVKILHEIRAEKTASPAIVETQTYVLLPDSKYTAPPLTGEAPDIDAEKSKKIVPDDILLFQYSALGFNTHKIHLDRSHARDVEGFPDLVVNGGLLTLLMTEFLQKELNILPRSITTRHVAPLFSNHSLTIAASQHDDNWVLRAYNNKNQLAAEMEVEI